MKKEKEVKLSIQIPESLRQKIWDYTHRKGLKIKAFICDLLISFFSRREKEGKGTKKQE